ncbi:MAG: hypothetical protein JXR25_12900 [Pontiellaceae bacterium]|nr:hypothetical protein [Pontiellaceae bacterium]MBN2785714.1 hypothetical protein [Pontiellaceae bacterium]
MKRVVQGLLVVAVVLPVCSVHAETMAERKQRIMRKYLRERQNVTQSGVMLPTIDAENERIAASEIYKSNTDMNSQGSPTALMPVNVRPVRIQNNSKSAWYQESDDLEDPYADPFARGTATDEKKESSADRWATWKKMREDRAARNDSGNSGYATTVNPYAAQAEGYTSSGNRYGQSTDSGQTEPGRIGPYGTTDYTSAPTGLLQLPTSTVGESTIPSTTQGYTPYQSPYQNQRRSSTIPDAQQQQSQQNEYERTSPYQQWKKNNNQSWDPTADDAYVNELMKNRRR